MTKKNIIKVKLVRSVIGQNKRTRDTVKGLGLRKVNSVSELSDTPQISGMVAKVKHLVEIL